MQGMLETQVPSLGWEDPLEEEMATHSSILVWINPWTEEPGGLQSMGSHRIRHNWASEHAHMHNALIYTGKLNQKSLYNKVKLKTRWTHILHCPFLTHISGGKSSAKKYAIFFTGIIDTGFYIPPPPPPNLKLYFQQEFWSPSWPESQRRRGCPWGEGQAKRGGCYFLPFSFTSNGLLPSRGNLTSLIVQSSPLQNLIFLS